VAISVLAVGIGQRAGQGIVLDRVERGQEDTRLHALEQAASEDRDADLRRVRLAARALERAGQDRVDRIAAVGAGRHAAVAVGPGALAAGGKLAGRVHLPRLEERIHDGRAVAIEHPSGQPDPLAGAAGEQDRAAVAPEQLPVEEGADGLGGRGGGHGHSPIGVARVPRSTMSKR